MVVALRNALLLTLLVLAGAGCQLRLDVDVVVDRAGGGRLEVVLGADAELLRRAADAGVDPLRDVAATVRSLRDSGWRVREAQEDDGSRSVTLEVAFAGPEEFERRTGELAEALAAPEVRLLEPFTLELTADRVVLTGVASLTPTDAVADAGLQPADAVRLVREANAVRYRVGATLPGPVVERSPAPAGGDGADGRTVRWEVAPGEAVAFSVVSERPQPPRWPIVLGGLVGAAAAGAVLWWRWRTAPRR